MCTFPRPSKDRRGFLHFLGLEKRDYRRAAVCNSKFVDDARTRKLTIADGKGTVHGIPYDLEDTFGLILAPL